MRLAVIRDGQGKVEVVSGLEDALQHSSIIRHMDAEYGRAEAEAAFGRGAWRDASECPSPAVAAWSSGALAEAQRQGFWRATAPEGCPLDIAREWELGCEGWSIEVPGIGSGYMARWPNGRGAICTGGDSHWGDWILDNAMVLDAKDADGEPVWYDGEGKMVGRQVFDSTRFRILLDSEGRGSRAKAAEVAGVSRQTIDNWCKGIGGPSGDQERALTRAFGWAPDAILKTVGPEGK